MVYVTQTILSAMKRFIFPGVIVLVLLIAVGLIVMGQSGSRNNSTSQQTASVKSSPDSLPGLLTGSAPWPNNINQLADRLRAIALPQLGSEGTALHIHQHLDIYIEGKQITVPAGIGIPNPETYISPIHTHDTRGIIHVESPTLQDYYLGQFFDIWGVKFTSNCIGGSCSTADKQISVYTNGKQYTGNPRQVKLLRHQEIVITYGTPVQLPNPIPVSYPFPNGL